MWRQKKSKEVAVAKREENTTDHVCAVAPIPWWSAPSARADETWRRRPWLGARPPDGTERGRCGFGPAIGGVCRVRDFSYELRQSGAAAASGGAGAAGAAAPRREAAAGLCGRLPKPRAPLWSGAARGCWPRAGLRRQKVDVYPMSQIHYPWYVLVTGVNEETWISYEPIGGRAACLRLAAPPTGPSPARRWGPAEGRARATTGSSGGECQCS